MAKVPNPLHRYRSSQYHLMLIASNSDVVKLDSVNSEEGKSYLTLYSHPTGGPTTKYDKKHVSDIDIVVVYNSMTDVEFSIDTLTLEYMLSAGGSSKQYTATNVSGENTLVFEVIEPYTADFLDVLHVAASNLGTTIANLNFGLKIVFVGYPDDNNVSAPHLVADINLIPFMVKDVSMNLTARGAHYTINGIPTFNNGANHPSVSKIGGTTTTLPESVPDAISKFESEANAKAKQTKDMLPDSKPYKYKIILDDAYKDPKYNLDVVADDQRNTFGNSKPLTKNNTPSGKVPNYSDQTAETETPSKTGASDTLKLQDEKNTEGYVSNTPWNKNTTGSTSNVSSGGIVSNDPGYNSSTTASPTIVSNDPKFLQDAEDKLRSLDKDNYARYKDYRDNDFITSVQNGVNPDKALNDARMKASQKFSDEIANALQKTISPKK